MPVNYRQKPGTEIFYQRFQYNKGGLTKLYWDYRDRVICDSIPIGAKVILDAGCGEGLTLKKIIDRHPNSQVSGIDISEENISICEHFGLPVAKGDIFHLAVPENSVDCCVLSEVIEHLDQPELALNRIQRVLKTQGRLVVVFPNDFVFKCARLITFKFKEAFYNCGHFRQWTPSAIKQCLETAGFAVIAARNLPFKFWRLSLHGIVIAVKLS
jgi:ubiquinone/menaquinone biosynthesis C-methylase UbiE